MTNNKSHLFSNAQIEVAEIAKAISHPARIAIMQLLAKKKEIKSGDISEDLPLSRTTVSQHLQVLKKAGIIRGHIEGLEIHYCLNTKKIKEIMKKYNNLFQDVSEEFKCNC